MTPMFYANLAHNDFEKAQRRAFWRGLFSRLTGKQNKLLSLNDLPGGPQYQGGHYLGLRIVPLDKILGSEGRSHEFDREFYPRQASTRERWVRVYMAHYQDVYLPPVELLKLGEVYFVRDGNHRVSVARMRGQQYVDAVVTEIRNEGRKNERTNSDYRQSITNLSTKTAFTPGY